MADHQPVRPGTVTGATAVPVIRWEVLKAEGSLRHSAWEMALWSAESWSLFAGARLVKPYFRRVLDRL